MIPTAPFYTQQRDPPVQIKDVVVDLMDGKMLLNLLEVLLNTTLVKTIVQKQATNLKYILLFVISLFFLKLVKLNWFRQVTYRPFLYWRFFNRKDEKYFCTSKLF